MFFEENDVQNAREDDLAIEAAADLLAEGLNKSDISSLTDLVTEQTIVMAPARATFQGRSVIEFLRNLALRNENFRLLSTKLDPIGEGVVRDIGTLSMRPRKGERTYFRYMILWHRVGAEWKLASMTWNRDAQATAPSRGQHGGAKAGSSTEASGMEDM